MYAKVNEIVAQFLLNNKIVTQGTNLLYTEVLEINRPIEMVKVENSEELQGIDVKKVALPQSIKLKCCPSLSFIPGIDVELL